MPVASRGTTPARPWSLEPLRLRCESFGGRLHVRRQSRFLDRRVSGHARRGGLDFCPGPRRAGRAMAGAASLSRLGALRALGPNSCATTYSGRSRAPCGTAAVPGASCRRLSWSCVERDGRTSIRRDGSSSPCFLQLLAATTVSAGPYPAEYTVRLMRREPPFKFRSSQRLPYRARRRARRQFGRCRRRQLAEPFDESLRISAPDARR